VDDFTQQLWNIYLKVQEEGIAQVNNSGFFKKKCIDLVIILTLRYDMRSYM